jgi:hypothetical protein
MVAGRRKKKPRTCAGLVGKGTCECPGGQSPPLPIYGQGRPGFQRPDIILRVAYLSRYDG